MSTITSAGHDKSKRTSVTSFIKGEKILVASYLLNSSSILFKKWTMVQQVKHLPAAKLMVPGSWDQVQHWAPCSTGSLLLPLPLPASLLTYAVSLCVR